MIELKPNIYDKFKCPECNSNNIEILRTVFPGIHILADINCKNCNNKYFSDFPIGHALLWPVSFNQMNYKIYYGQNSKWFSEPLINSYRNQSDEPISIEKKTSVKKNEVIILNCIDYLYGHVLLKLFNAQEYIENFNNLGLIIIIPKQFEWLLPDGICEAWLIDIKLKDALKWLNQLDSFIQNELKRFKKIYLSIAFSHPDFENIDIEKFTGVRSFSLKEFTERAPIITFVIREDRFWGGNNLTETILRIKNEKIIKKIKLIRIIIKKVLAHRQNKKIIKTIKIIKQKLPEVTFNIVGIGKRRKFPSFVKDFTKEQVNFETELLWCETYAVSHIVIGVHGSNMILPTALAAGFIELLPKSRIPNFLQDIAKHINGRLDVFLSRFVSNNILPNELAETAVSMIRDFSIVQNLYGKEYIEHKLHTSINKWTRK